MNESMEELDAGWRRLSIYSVIWAVASVLMLAGSLWYEHAVMCALWGLQAGTALSSLHYHGQVKVWRKMLAEQRQALRDYAQMAITAVNERDNVIRRQEWLSKSPPY